MVIKHLKRTLLTVMLTSMTALAYAEDVAPVYDADNMPSQFDGQQQDNGLPPSSQPIAQAGPHPEQAFSTPENLTNEQRLGRLEQQIKELQRSNSSSKTDELQSEVQTLRGQVEQLTHQLQTLQTQSTQTQNQLKSMYTDLDKRLSKQGVSSKTSRVSTADTSDKSSATDDATAGSQPKSSAHNTASKQSDSIDKSTDSDTADKPDASSTNGDQPNVAEEQQTYQTAYDLIKAKKYNDAISSLQGMLKKYPSGQFAANAHYWLGELYGLTGKNDQSVTEFSSVVKDFPSSPKVADAHLKLGMIYSAEQKWPEAKSSFKKVINRYPGTTSARLASEQLKQLKQAGH